VLVPFLFQPMPVASQLTVVPPIFGHPTSTSSQLPHACNVPASLPQFLLRSPKVQFQFLRQQLLHGAPRVVHLYEVEAIVDMRLPMMHKQLVHNVGIEMPRWKHVQHVRCHLLTEVLASTLTASQQLEVGNAFWLKRGSHSLAASPLLRTSAFSPGSKLLQSILYHRRR